MSNVARAEAAQRFGAEIFDDESATSFVAGDVVPIVQVGDGLAVSCCRGVHLDSIAELRGIRVLKIKHRAKNAQIDFDFSVNEDPVQPAAAAAAVGAAPAVASAAAAAKKATKGKAGVFRLLVSLRAVHSIHLFLFILVFEWRAVSHLSHTPSDMCSRLWNVFLSS